MNQKYFIVTGNYDQFRAFTNKKHRELWDSGIVVEYTDFIYATPESIRGHRNPRGWFWGTWRDRKDIDEIITHLRIYHSNQNVVLDRIHCEVRERENSKTV
jgi:hypothetical protein